MNQHEDPDLSSLIKAKSTRYELPPELRTRVVAALRHSPQQEKTTGRSFWLSFQQKWMGMGIAFACGVIASMSIVLIGDAPKNADRVSQDVLAGHIRSLMVAHLEDVVSTDQHTVKPWFSGKLDFSPPVHDLSKEGFPLVGGRLDYLDQRAVAALVYRHQQHAINLFVWPARDDSNRELKIQSRQGYNMVEWSDQDMQFWAVSDLNSPDLQNYVQLLRQKLNLKIK